MKADHPTPAAYAAAAWLLDCEVSAIRAFAEVEAGPHGAFLDSGEPVILFERHVFHRETAGVFDGASVPFKDKAGTADTLILSLEKPGGYGPVSLQHPKLEAAITLCQKRGLRRDPALRSCSWGLFQIMGFNHARAGFSTLQDFVNAMYAGVDWHLRAFVMFVRSDPKLVRAIRDGDWTTAAERYNGRGFRKAPKPWYDERMAAAHRKIEERRA